MIGLAPDLSEVMGLAPDSEVRGFNSLYFMYFIYFSITKPKESTLCGI